MARNESAARAARALCAGLLVLAVTVALRADKDDEWVASRKNWWAFQKPVRPEVPALADSWVRTPIDAFLLDAMRAKGLRPMAGLGKEKSIRRLTLDLTGLPPAAEEVDRFLADTSPTAWETLVDRLMRSPHYGERWATRWLDIVRYADTNGFEADAERPHAWRYRDYVVQSFNSDKPYDRFIREQIAGDELFPGNVEALIATGFHRAGPVHVVGGMQDEEMNRQEVLTEMTGAIGSTFLGLTIGCARCHNHKFDPIPQADYYRLEAVLAATEGKDIPIASEAEKQAYEEARKAHQARLAPVRKQIEEVEAPYRERLREAKKQKLDPALAAALEVPKDKRTPEQARLAKDAEAQIKVAWDELLAAIPADVRERRAALRGEMHRLNLEAPDPPPAAFAVVNKKEAPRTHILKAGNHKMKLEAVEAGFPRVIDRGTVTAAADGRRAALAEWLASEANPLTARVMVNRIWQLRMGRALAGTPNDFGVLGARPSNPKLLDWLAAEFIAQGWSIRKLDRIILLSSAYRMAAGHTEANMRIDPDNRYYWRANRRRLEAEFLRDSVLAVSGGLNAKLAGKPVRAPIEPEIYDLIFTEGEPDNLWPVAPDESEHRRRSLYLLNKRTVRLPFLANFDQPDHMTSCPTRPASTHALQALSLMNSGFMRAEARRFAERLDRECGADFPCRLRRAYKLALARTPSAVETGMARRFVEGGGPWEDFCLAMLNRNEFAYVP